MMNDLHDFEKRVKEITSHYRYPPTPNISTEVFRRVRQEDHKRQNLSISWLKQVAIVAVALTLAFLAAFSVPTVRAQILEFLQIGGIRIFFTQPTSTLTSDVSQQTDPASHIYPSLGELAGETTLEQARSKVSFMIPLPTYPQGIGFPSRVYLQGHDEDAVLLIWFSPERPDDIFLNLLIAGQGALLDKTMPEVIVHTSVGGEPAVWTKGEHYLMMINGVQQRIPLVVQGNILIWERDGITYRLETGLSVQEAVKIAESLTIP